MRSGHGPDYIQGTTCDGFFVVLLTCVVETDLNSGLPSNLGGMARPAAGEERPLDAADELAEAGLDEDLDDAVEYAGEDARETLPEVIGLT